MKKIVLPLCLLIAGWWPNIFAKISVGLNHPELTWKYRETPHFKIIYHQGIERLAEQAAIVAEAVYPTITADLKINPSVQISLIISDYDDLSNGLSYPIGRYIFIWAKSFSRYTTDTMQWLRRVIAHELTHQFHYLASSNFLGTPWELLSLGTTPSWFTEGVAQYEAERWDAHRELLLGVATRSTALLPRKRLEGFMDQDEIDSRLIYEQGHSLVRYIADKYGPEKIHQIIRKHRQIPLSFNWALKRSIGVSESKLIREWQQPVEAHYQSANSHPEYLSARFAPFQKKLQATYAIRWSPDSTLAAVVGIESFHEGVTRLYLFDTSGNLLRVLDEPRIGGYFSWAPDGSALVYTKLRRGKHGALINDLFILDVASGHKHALTYNLRATDPCWSPDGQKIVFCQHQGPFSNLVIYDRPTKTMQPITAFDEWTEVYSPDWHPEGSLIAFSLIDPHGWRDIAMIQPDGKNLTRLTRDSTDDRTPVWSPTGEQLAYISYRTGQPNLFLMNPQTRSCKQLTWISGGLFNPTWTPDGQSVTVIAFEQRDSIHAFTIPINHINEITATTRATNNSSLDWHNTLPPQVAPIEVPANYYFQNAADKSYHSLLHIRPQLTIPYFDTDDAGLQAGIFNITADPLNKHEFQWSITQGKRTHYFIDYTNRQLLPLLHFYATQTSHDRGHFLGERLIEKSLSYGFSLLFPFNFGDNIYANHLFWLNADAIRITNYNQAVFQNYPDWQQPFTGWLNGLSIGYAYAKVRPSLSYDIHPDAGFKLSTSLRRNDERLNSGLSYTQFSVTTVFRRRSFLRHQILAMQVGYFQHQGEQRLQTRYALGSSMIRGFGPSEEGTQMIVANLEYRWPIFNNLGLKIWYLYLEKLCGTAFVDLGKVWGNRLAISRQTKRFIWWEQPFDKADLVGTFGAELRLRLYLAGKLSLVLRGGVARRWDQSGNELEYYYLLGPVF